MADNEYLSGCQLRQYLHISTRKMKYLMDHNIIPHVNTGKATHRYLVTKKDADEYLARIETDVQLNHELQGKFSSKGKSRTTPYIDASEETCERFKQWLIIKWTDIPDAMSLKMVNELVGLTNDKINVWADERDVEIITVRSTRYVTKYELIKKLSSTETLSSFRSKKFMKLIDEFKNNPTCREA